MGVMSDTVIANGGYTTGVIPTFLRDREIAHENLSELIIVNNMSERKAKMMLLGDAFIALPGGPGTLEEISEVISWSRIGQNDNPCILYNLICKIKLDRKKPFMLGSDKHHICLKGT
ncbi:lysine decarboxylase, partial [Streptococcus agalactiae MRI Z1-213]